MLGRRRYDPNCSSGMSGYETFLSRLDCTAADQPDGCHVNASVLKIKLAMAILHSSIHLLRTLLRWPLGSVGPVHRGERDVAGYHPHRVRAVRDRHRLCREAIGADPRAGPRKEVRTLIWLASAARSKLLPAMLGRWQ